MPFYSLRWIKLVMHQYLGSITTLHVGKGMIIMCSSYYATVVLVRTPFLIPDLKRGSALCLASLLQQQEWKGAGGMLWSFSVSHCSKMLQQVCCACGM